MDRESDPQGGARRRTGRRRARRARPGRRRRLAAAAAATRPADLARSGRGGPAGAWVRRRRSTLVRSPGRGRGCSRVVATVVLAMTAVYLTGPRTRSRRCRVGPVRGRRRSGLVADVGAVGCLAIRAPPPAAPTPLPGLLLNGALPSVTNVLLQGSGGYRSRISRRGHWVRTCRSPAESPARSSRSRMAGGSASASPTTRPVAGRRRA